MPELPSGAGACGPARSSEPFIANRGVTLLELLVVMALASIMLALVFPSVGSSLQGLELSSAARRLAEASRYARDQAVFRQSTFQLEIDSASRTIAVADLGQAPGSARRFELPASVRIARILPEEPEEEEGSVGGPRRFLFMPDGVAPQFQVVLANPRRQVTVSNDPLTGAATVSAGAPAVNPSEAPVNQ